MMVGALFPYSRERLLTVFGLDDLIVGRGKHIADNPAAIRLVLHHQNALGHAGSACRSTMTGRVNANVEPCPGCDSIQILPPCISICASIWRAPNQCRPSYG